VAVDTKRRETDIVRPFIYGSVESLYSLLRNLRGKNGSKFHTTFRLSKFKGLPSVSFLEI
jgi:hypothetical protein